MTKFYEWTKRLGQQHYSMSGEHETLCGMPMLGNNYADSIDQRDKQRCPTCDERMKSIQTGELVD